MFGTLTYWSDDGGEGRCPFVGPTCPWPCPPGCRCPGECPMDVSESDDAMDVQTVDATDYGRPFFGAHQSWPCSSSGRCTEGCAMDVDEPDESQVSYCWPYNVTNGVNGEQQCDEDDFTASYVAHGGGSVSDDREYLAWLYSVTNNVQPAQRSVDGPSKIADDSDSGNESDSSGGVIIIV